MKKYQQNPVTKTSNSFLQTGKELTKTINF